MLVTCPGCDTRYDVNKRAPGKRLRCARCKAEVVVPERPASVDPEATTSGRLRRARGPVCLAHPKRSAEDRCDACRSWTCSSCWAPAPADHLCVRCADERELGAALPIDFGPVATPLLAVRALAWSLPRVLAWNVLSILTVLMLFGIPLSLGLVAWDRAGRGGPGGELAAAVVLASLFGAFIAHYLLLMPAGCAVFIDQAIRGRETGFFAGLRDAWDRASANATGLAGVLLAAALAFLPWLMLTAGIAFAVHEGMAPSPAAAPMAALVLVVVGTIGLVPVVVGFGLAVPVVILEARGAVSALGRAWELVRLQPLVFSALVVGFFVFSGVVGLVIAQLVVLLGLPAAVGHLLSHLVDLLWPALLVAAYHGLVAEQVGVPGRK